MAFNVQDSVKLLTKKPTLLIVAGIGGLGVSFFLLRKLDKPTNEPAPLQPIEISIPGTVRPAERGSTTLDDGPVGVVEPIKPKKPDISKLVNPKPALPQLPKSPVAPVGSPTAPVNPTPAPTPTKEVKPSYPGIPAGFELRADNTYTGLLGTFEQMKRTQLSKGKGPTFTNRNTTAIALQGTPTPWIGKGPFDAANVNQRRVKFGLYPLTQEEFDAMRAHMKELSRSGSEGINGDENARRFFARWNAPYQLGMQKRINNK